MNLILTPGRHARRGSGPRGGRMAARARCLRFWRECPRRARRRIFDHAAYRALRSGPGLGLSVVHGVVNRHHGSVRVRSEHGGGTTITLWLPAGHAREVESRPAAAAAVNEPSHPEPSGSVRSIGVSPGDGGADHAAGSAAVSILVIEDEEQIRTMLVDALAEAGHNVESATDGLAGLARFQGGHFDVVLTDLSLPECSGLDVARSVKRMHPETPVVLITGWGHLLNPERLRESGIDLMLVKPFRLERLLSVLGDALRLRPIV